MRAVDTARPTPTSPPAAWLLQLQSAAGNRAVTAYVQRQSVQTANGSRVGNAAGGTNNIREEVLAVMDRLHALWSIPTPDHAAEYPTVLSKPANTSLAPAEIPKTISGVTSVM